MLVVTIIENHVGLVGREGIEPSTNGLRVKESLPMTKHGLRSATAAAFMPPQIAAVQPSHRRARIPEDPPIAASSSRGRRDSRRGCTYAGRGWVRCGPTGVL